MSCAVPGCESRVTCRGYCNVHYHRWHRTGDALSPRKLRVIGDLEGLKFHHVTVGKEAPRIYGRRAYWYTCECGVTKAAPVDRILRQRPKSCGCRSNEFIAQSKRTHGDTDSPTWKTWKSMLDRCQLPAHKSWKDYGGRGITVCPSWHTYQNFKADMGERPVGTQLDRVDNSGNYGPNNCRWATPRQNANNRRSSVFLECNGERLTVSQWARRLRCCPSAISKRIEEGWTVAEAVSRSTRQQKNSWRLKHEACAVRINAGV